MVVLAFVVGFGIGEFGLIPLRPQRPIVETSAPAPLQGQTGAYDQGYRDALNLARTKVATLLPRPREGGTILNGTIKSLQDNRIVVTLNASQIDFFLEGKTDKTFFVTPGTSIDQRVDKTLDQYNADLMKYNEDMDTFRATQDPASSDSALSLSPVPPDFFLSSIIALKDLKVGDPVEVITKSDLQSADPFEAVSVHLSARPPDLKSPGPSVP